MRWFCFLLWVCFVGFACQSSAGVHFRPFQRDLGTKLAQSLEYARVPVDRGTLVVFSNYQLVHRVLRMELLQKARKPAGAHEGHRDFLAFFVIDQRHPLQSTANRPGDFAKPIETQTSRKDPELCSDSEEEAQEEVSSASEAVTAASGGLCGGDGSSTGSGQGARAKPNQIGEEEEEESEEEEMVRRRRIRDSLLQEQLQPAGRFGSDRSIVYSTGNGSAAYVGFLNQGRGGGGAVPAAAQEENDPTSFVPDDADASGLLESGILSVERSLNITPPVLGRGLSWGRDNNEQATLFNPQSRWHELRIVDGATGEAVEWLYTSYLPYEVKRVRRNIDRPWAEGVSSFSEEVRGDEDSQLDTPSSSQRAAEPL